MTQTRTQYTLEQKQELVAKINKLLAVGMNVKEASKQVGIVDRNYYTWKKLVVGKKTALRIKRKYTRRKTNAAVEMLSIPLSDSKADRVVEILKLLNGLVN